VLFLEELPMSRVISQEALTRLLVENRVFTKRGFLDMVKVVEQRMRRGRRKRET